MKKLTTIIVVVLIAITVTSTVCTKRTHQAPPCKLVILGVDGGDWLNLRPLIEQGRLPNFARLVNEGATGPLRSMEPMLSPLLWTTMATGKYPEDHGILNFTVLDPETGNKVPITRYSRKVDAIWNMLGDYGRKSAVVGWLATHPAEKIDGVMVTDKMGYVGYAPQDRERGTAGTVYPESRTGEISELVVKGADVPYDECSNIVHVGREEFERHRSADFDTEDSINNLILLYSSAASFRNIGLYLLENDKPDLLAVYFEWVDAVSHLFMLHSPPKLPDIPDDEYEKFKDAIDQTYIVQDRIIGEFMDRVDENTIIMVISDHGFKSGVSRLKNRPEIWAGHAAAWHRPDGIVAFWGQGVRKGSTIEGASIIDIAPTILALLGLPRATDMPGHIMTQAFEMTLRAKFNGKTVKTLEKEREEEEKIGSGAGTASEETMKKLEALGYVTRDKKAPGNADSYNNLGQRYQERGEYEKAINEYEKAIEVRPGFYAAYNNMAVCYGKLKRYEKAEAALKKTIELKPDDYYAMNNLAVTYIETGRLDDARQIAEQAVQTEPGYVNGRSTLGAVYAMMGDLEKAEKEFEKVLELDPGNVDATRNLERVRQQLRSVRARSGESQ